MDKPKQDAFLLRMRPGTRQLVQMAAEDQRRSMTSIIEEAVREHLQPRYGKLDERVQRFLSGVKQ